MRLLPLPVPPGVPVPHAGAGGVDWTTFNQIYLAVAAVATGLLVAFFTSRNQARRDTQTGVQASRQEVSTNYSMAMTYMRETVAEVRAEAEAARAAEKAAEQRLRELRAAFRAFGEEALSKAPGATWSTQAMDTLFNLGLSIAEVERSRDRVSNHVERIVDKVAAAESAVNRVQDAADQSPPQESGDGPPAAESH